MSFLSSVFNLSSGTPVNGGNVSRGAAPGPTPVVIIDPAAEEAARLAAEAAAKPNSSLDKYVALWQTPTTPDGKPAAIPVDPLTQPLFNIDQAKIVESAGKMDFTSGIPPELATKALSGDAAALGELINGAIRNAVVGMTMQNGQMVNNAVTTNNQRITAALPQHISRTQLLNEQPENPVFSHPAAQPLVHSLKQMAFAKNPSANPADISAEINGFLTGFAQAIVESMPENQQKQQKAAAAEVDWTKYL